MFQVVPVAAATQKEAWPCEKSMKVSCVCGVYECVMGRGVHTIPPAPGTCLRTPTPHTNMACALRNNVHTYVLLAASASRQVRFMEIA